METGGGQADGAPLCTLAGFGECHAFWNLGVGWFCGCDTCRQDVGPGVEGRWGWCCLAGGIARNLPQVGARQRSGVSTRCRWTAPNSVGERVVVSDSACGWWGRATGEPSGQWACEHRAWTNLESPGRAGRHTGNDVAGPAACDQHEGQWWQRDV